MSRVRSASWSVARMLGDRSLATFSHAGREEGAKRRQLLLDRIDRPDDVRSGWRLITSSTAGLVVEESGVVTVLDASFTLRDIPQPHRRAVVYRTTSGGSPPPGELIAGLDLPLPLAVLDHALGPQQVGADDGAADVLERDAVMGQGVRVELTRTAGSEPPPTVTRRPRYLRDLLREHRGREVVHFARGLGFEVSARIMIGACDGLILR